MPEIHLIDFLEFYRGTPEQKEAIQLLQSAMPDSLLKNKSAWVKQYRAKPEKPPIPEWPLSKEQLGRIMGCLPRYLPDDLMDDLARACDVFEINTPIRLSYFLGQCGEESAGLRYPLEIASGAAYEWRNDLGNTHAGDGRKFKGAGFIQVTGRGHAQKFSDYLKEEGHYDAHIMEEGSRYTGNHYPWSISAYWWADNMMNEYVDGRPEIDRVGQRVNGVYPPRGAEERRLYTERAFEELL